MSQALTGAYWLARGVFSPRPTQTQAHENAILGRPPTAGHSYAGSIAPAPPSAGTDGLVDALNQVIEQRLSEINTNMPAVIVSYDAARNRAVVRPSLPKRLADDEPLEAPQIIEVPVVWPASGAGKASLTFPLKPGDGVMLAVQQRSMENWLSGNNTAPDDPRQFDLSDCVAFAGMSHNGTVAHDEDIVLKFNKTEVRIKPDDTIVVGNDKAGITIDAAGTMTLKAETINLQAGSIAMTQG